MYTENSILLLQRYRLINFSKSYIIHNTAREELKKKFKIFSNSLPQLQLFAWPRNNFFKIWNLYDIKSKILSLIEAKKTSKIFMGTRDTIKNVQSYLSWILIYDHGSRPVCCSPPSLRQDRIGHAQRWRLSGALLYEFLILFISNFYF